jgi:hypothetical protein
LDLKGGESELKLNLAYGFSGNVGAVLVFMEKMIVLALRVSWQTFRYSILRFVLNCGLLSSCLVLLGCMIFCFDSTRLCRLFLSLCLLLDLLLFGGCCQIRLQCGLFSFF